MGVGGTEWEWGEYRVGRVQSGESTEWVVQSGWYRVGGTEWEWGEYRVGVVGGRDSTQ